MRNFAAASLNPYSTGSNSNTVAINIDHLVSVS